MNASTWKLEVVLHAPGRRYWNGKPFKLGLRFTERQRSGRFVVEGLVAIEEALVWAINHPEHSNVKRLLSE